MCHAERTMALESQSTCNCNVSSSSVGSSGVIINDVNGLSNFTCDGRATNYFIKCLSHSDLKSSSSEFVIVLIGFCLLLTLVSMSLYNKMKKDTKYYKGKIDALEKNLGWSDSNEPKTSEWKYFKHLNLKITINRIYYNWNLKHNWNTLLKY